MLCLKRMGIKITNEIVSLEKEKIENLIYEIRGQMVMLDSDMS